MDSIRFEPTVSATFAIDRNPSGNGGDLFTDMLGEQLKKRADADRPDPITRRRPQAERRIQDEDHPATGRPPHIVIKNSHEFNDTATTARDVTPNRDVQPTLPAPARDRPACMDDQTTTDEAMAGTVEDKDQRTDQQEPVLVSAQVLADAPAEEADQAVVIAIDPQAPTLIEDQTLPAAETTEAAATITPVETELASPTVEPAADPTVDPAADPTVDPAAASAADTEAQAEDAPAQASFAADLAASLDDTMVGLMASDAAAASAQVLASASLTTLAAPKAATPAMAEAPQAAAVELAAKITPDAPRPAAEIKPRPAMRTTPAAEIKAQTAANQAPQATAAPQAAAQAAPIAALGEASSGVPDADFPSDGATTPGWTLHLAQGAAAKRPDFIAQLRQHLQELPAHEQVAVNIQRALREGTGRLSIQLSPAELGKIHVKLEIDEEKRVTAAVTVEKPSTLELLQRDVKALERALQDAGLKMDGSDLSFSLGRHDGKEFSQDMKHSGPAGYGDGPGEAQAEGDVPTGQAAELVNTAAGLVNVQI